MTEVLVDSDILSYLVKGNARVQEHVRAYLETHALLSISVPTYFEVRRGLEDVGSPRRLNEFEQWCSLNRILPLDRPICEVASRLHASLKRRGRLIDDVDLLIAATALHHRMALATHILRHFVRIPGLTVWDWTR